MSESLQKESAFLESGLRTMCMYNGIDFLKRHRCFRYDSSESGKIVDIVDILVDNDY